MSDPTTEVLSVLIIGAGFSGVGLGLRLQKAGVSDFLIIEAEDGIGGTWWLNRYPGCACDVQSHLYSLSFAPRADWSRQFPPRAEIQAALAEEVRHRGLEARIRLSTRLAEARWDAQKSIWRARDQNGRVHLARVLVSAIGGLSRPARPSGPCG